MTESLTLNTVQKLAEQLKEPSWMTELRQAALTRHGELPWPHPSDDVWRRTDYKLLDPADDFTLVEPESWAKISPAPAPLEWLTKQLGNEHLIVRVNGSWKKQEAPKGVLVSDLAEAARTHPEPIRKILESDDLTEAEQKLTTLNAAFHHDDLFIEIPSNTLIERPIRMVHVLCASTGQVLFPWTVIRVGAGSQVTLIDEYTSLADQPPGASHLVNARIDLEIEPGATVHYVRIQRWGSGAREFLLQRCQVGRDAKLSMANINIGSAVSKAHIITRLIGEQATTKLYGFVFGHDKQHVDQHTLQDHRSPHTFSDLQFRAALQDASRMIYTGLIRIAASAQQSGAYQANHNLLLSEKANAETIPMLEILADDVQCKHGASIGPIDEEMIFYLRSRGLAREAAERLIVMGFVESMVQQVPFEPLQERLRQEIEGELRS